MPGLFSRLKARDGTKSKKKHANNAGHSLPSKPEWDDAYTRRWVEPEEVHELIHCCTEELKARALDHPFLLLPFRPTSDPSAVRTFVRHFFDQIQSLRGEALLQELRMTEPMVISGVVKWCWSRLQGGVVGWYAYELFKVGESDSNMARDSFKTFIPISVENGARQRIIFDFFELMAAVAAHGKVNGLGGRKLSRLAAWWAFEQKNTTEGFDAGYKAWLSAADATSHLFFAYLRSLSPDQTVGGISLLPMALQKLLQETEYPPQRPILLMTRTSKVAMIVNSVSPTPFALLRRANHFQYRDSDKALQEFSEFEDPVQALTEECRRVLKAISAANQSQVSSSKHSTSLRDASWSRFEDIGFSSALEEEDEDEDTVLPRKHEPQGLRRLPASGTTLARPTTPSWADFLSSGFVDDVPARANVLLPPDKVLPPIDVRPRQRSAQSHHPRLESDSHLEPGELASISDLDLDEAFWWVWMNSLAPEEPPERKGAFGRCAVIESKIRSARWLVMEEMVTGAAPEPEEGAYLAEKKGFFSWTKRSKGVGRNKSTAKRGANQWAQKSNQSANAIQSSAGPDTHAKIQAKAAQLRAHEDQERRTAESARRGRIGPSAETEKTNSVMTLPLNIAGEASSAMKWVSKYDKGAIRDAYMANSNAGRGMAISPAPSSLNISDGHSQANGVARKAQEPPQVPAKNQSVATDAPHVTPNPTGETSARDVPNPGATVEDSAAPTAPAAAAPVGKDGKPMHAPTEKADVNGRGSPLPPPKDEPAEPVTEQATNNSVELSPRSKKKQAKLTKDHKEKSGGLKKLFGRKTRVSKLPEDSATKLNEMLQRDQPQPRQEGSLEKVETHHSAAGRDAPAVAEEADLEERTERGPDSPGAEPALAEPTYEPSLGETLSHVDSQDADEAKREFSRFDQGPLTDQPATAPGDSDPDDATPPPIARRPLPRSNTSLSNSKSKGVADPPEERLSQTAGPGVQDRWAQIRKNAAERARQKDERRGIRHSRATEDSDDTSGEETIESRVAKIKARVAELTSNMELSNGPQQ